MPEPRPDDADPAPAGPVRVRRRRKRRSWARRKHLGLITVGAALAVLVLGVLLVMLTWDGGARTFAQQVDAAARTTSSAPGSPAPGPPAPTSSAPASSPAAGQPSSGAPVPGLTTVRGTITEIGDQRWTVKGSNGLTYTVVVTDATTLARKRDFGSYVIGDALTAKGTLDQGTLTAASVTPARGS